MKQRLKSWLPTPQSLRSHRWLRWLGPLLHQPRLWHFSRKGIALGLALGVFFGLLIPVAQIPAAATLAVVLRANLPVAVASTLVTNPITFAPVYYGAYRLGRAVLGEPALDGAASQQALQPMHADADSGTDRPVTERWRQWMERLGGVGKPLVVGLAIIASAAGIGCYVLVSALWALRVRWSRRRRLGERRRRVTGTTPP